MSWFPNNIDDYVKQRDYYNKRKWFGDNFEPIMPEGFYEQFDWDFQYYPLLTSGRNACKWRFGENLKNQLQELGSYRYEFSFLPDQVFFNKKKGYTTLLYGDDATVVKCGKDDTYDKRIGFLEAFFKANCGLSKRKANIYLENIVKEES